MSRKKRTPHELIERIRSALKELRLPAMAQQLDELMTQSSVIRSSLARTPVF